MPLDNTKGQAKLKAFLFSDGWWWTCYQKLDGTWVPFFRVGRKGDCMRF